MLERFSSWVLYFMLLSILNKIFSTPFSSKCTQMFLCTCIYMYIVYYDTVNGVVLSNWVGRITLLIFTLIIGQMFIYSLKQCKGEFHQIKLLLKYTKWISWAEYGIYSVLPFVYQPYLWCMRKLYNYKNFSYSHNIILTCGDLLCLDLYTTSFFVWLCCLPGYTSG